MGASRDFVPWVEGLGVSSAANQFGGFILFYQVDRLIRLIVRLWARVCLSKSDTGQMGCFEADEVLPKYKAANFTSTRTRRQSILKKVEMRSASLEKTEAGQRWNVEDIKNVDVLLRPLGEDDLLPPAIASKSRFRPSSNIQAKVSRSSKPFTIFFTPSLTRDGTRTLQFSLRFFACTLRSALILLLLLTLSLAIMARPLLPSFLSSCIDSLLLLAPSEVGGTPLRSRETEKRWRWLSAKDLAAVVSSLAARQVSAFADRYHLRGDKAD
jgi:hypothetical protein